MKEKPLLIAPSILSANFSRLEQEIREVMAYGGDLIHVDVMDGHFVPNLTIGPVVIRSIRKVSDRPFDVHLMIEEPIRYVEDFRKAGADWITVHVEACANVRTTLRKIKSLGAKAGLSVRPRTRIETIYPFLSMIDLVLVMTVEPGFGGQKFMSRMVPKVKKLRERFSGFISVDGGIDTDTAKVCRDAGANIFVVGSAIFCSPDRKRKILELRKVLS